MGPRLERFYADLLFEVGLHARTGGTAEGVGVVVKRVGLAHNVEGAATIPLPRLTRAERETTTWDQ